MKKGNIAEFKTWRRDFAPVMLAFVPEGVPNYFVDFNARLDPRPGKSNSRMSFLIENRSGGSPLIKAVSVSDDSVPYAEIARGEVGAINYAAQRLRRLYDEQVLGEKEAPVVNVSFSGPDNPVFYNYPIPLGNNTTVNNFLLLIRGENLWPLEGKGEPGDMPRKKEMILEGRINDFNTLQNYLNLFGNANKGLYRDPIVTLNLRARKRDKPGEKASRVSIFLMKDPFHGRRKGVFEGDLSYVVDDLAASPDLLSSDFAENYGFGDVKKAKDVLRKRRNKALSILRSLFDFGGQVRIKGYNSGKGFEGLERLRAKKLVEVTPGFYEERPLDIEDFRIDSARVEDESKR